MKNSAYLALLAILLFSTAEPLAQTCPRVMTRKEFRDLSAAEWNKFVAAVKNLNKRTPNGSEYDKLVKLHLDLNVPTHGNAMYFPFHRAFLSKFERDLQKLDPSLVVPYWDWSLDSQMPHLSPIFTDKYMGGNGQGANSEVRNGPFAQWSVLYPSSHNLQRRFNRGVNGISAFFSKEVLNQAISKATSYDAFRQSIEQAPAGAVHNGIGGDMSTMAGPNDPLYWLHIAFIDKLWSDWQKAHPNLAATVNGMLNNGQLITTTSVIPGIFPSYQVGDVLDTRKLCYTY